MAMRAHQVLAAPEGFVWSMSADRLQQSVDVTVDADGRPTSVVFPRWSDPITGRTYSLQPFGGFLSEFRDFGGFRLPTHVEAGNQFGTGAFFPFFIAEGRGAASHSEIAGHPMPMPFARQAQESAGCGCEQSRTPVHGAPPRPPRQE